MNYLRNLRHRLAHRIGVYRCTLLGWDDEGMIVACEDCGATSLIRTYHREKQVDIYVILAEDSSRDAD